MTEMEMEMEMEDKSSKRQLRPCPWQHPASRIVRVSRASGGKDRHSKVYTAKGLRDRRVRLSVSTAIQFYDLQDRLGYDQPSKAIEWLIKAAAAAIDELPSLDSSVFAPPAAKAENSSNSETSRGSVLSLSRSENRVKARERARERASKDKDAAAAAAAAENLSSFTDLLTGGDAAGRVQKNYFGSEAAGLFGHHHHHQPAAEMQQFAFLQPEHFLPVPTGGGDHYNLNFSIASGLAGFHRGTLQSNSPPHHQHHVDASGTMPFLFGGSSAMSGSQYSAGLDGNLQLCHGYKHTELKGKGKS